MKRPEIRSPSNALRRRKWLDSKGRLHRMHGPAAEWADGAKEWYDHGIRYRIEFSRLGNGFFRPPGPYAALLP